MGQSQGAQVPEILDVFCDRQKRFVMWFYCTTTIPPLVITRMLNSQFGTNFVVSQVRELVDEIFKRPRMKYPYKIPTGLWRCPLYFHIDCYGCQRPEEHSRLAFHCFGKTLSHIRCCTYDSAATSDSGSGSESAHTYIAPRELIEKPTEMSAEAPIAAQNFNSQNLLLFVPPIAAVLACTTLIRFHSPILSSIGRNWRGIQSCIIENALKEYRNLISLQTRVQINIERPWLFLSFTILFLMILGRANACLSSLSPMDLQTTTPPPGYYSTSSLRRWLSRRFPYFLTRNPTAQHREITINNLRAITRSLLLDIFCTLSLFFITFHIGWWITQVDCPRIRPRSRGLLMTRRQNRFLQERERLGEIFHDIPTYVSQCVLPVPGPRLGDFTEAGMLFLGFRYVFMVFFWVMGKMPVMVERFRMGYRGE